MGAATGTELRCTRCEQVLFVSAPGEVLPGEVLAAVVERHHATAHPELPEQRTDSAG